MPDAKCKRERKKKKKVTNIISFDDEEDEQSSGDVFKKIPGAGESSEENSDRSSINIMSAFESASHPRLMIKMHEQAGSPKCQAPGQS